MTRTKMRQRKLTARAIAGAKPFYIPRCAQCSTPLADAAGNPRWDVLEGRFVCLGQCRPVSRKAALS